MLGLGETDEEVFQTMKGTATNCFFFITSGMVDTKIVDIYVDTKHIDRKASMEK